MGFGEEGRRAHREQLRHARGGVRVRGDGRARLSGARGRRHGSGGGAAGLGRPSWACAGRRAGHGGARSVRERGRGGRKEEGRERKEKGKKKKRGKRNGKKEKEIEEKKMGGRERKKEGGREGAVRASGDCSRGRPRGCGPREMGHAVGGERKKERGKKRGRDSRRPVTTRRDGWERDGTWIEFGCRVVREGLWGLGFRV